MPDFTRVCTMKIEPKVRTVISVLTSVCLVCRLTVGPSRGGTVLKNLCSAAFVVDFLCYFGDVLRRRPPGCGAF